MILKDILLDYVRVILMGNLRVILKDILKAYLMDFQWLVVALLVMVLWATQMEDL